MPPPSPGAARGRLEVLLTDAPIDGNVTAINICFERVDVTFGDDDSPRVTIVDHPGTFELLSLRNGVTATLGVAELPSGFIQQVRVIICTEGNTIVVDGDEHPLTIPSGQQTGIKLTRPGGFEIRDNLTTTVVVDFDAAASVHFAPGQGYMLRPVVWLQDAAFVSILAPSAGEIVAPGPLLVRGEAAGSAGDPISEVIVNGVTATLTGETWTATVIVEATDSVFRIVAEAITVAGLRTNADIEVLVDVTPPSILFQAPAFLAATGTSDFQPTPRIVHLSADDPTTVALQVFAFDQGTGVATVTASLNGTPLLLEHGVTMHVGTLNLRSGDPGYSTYNVLRVQAFDAADNVARVDVEIRVDNRFHPSRLIVGFDANATSGLLGEITTALSAAVVLHDPSRRYAVIDVEPGNDILALAAEVSTMTGVRYALPDTPARPLPDITIPPNDAVWSFASLSRWHLQNDGSPATQLKLCDVDLPGSCQEGTECFANLCVDPTGRFAVDCCDCAADEHCDTEVGYRCVFTDPISECVKDGRADADIGWIDVGPQLETIAAGIEKVTIAVIEPDGIFDIRHRDLRANVFTNEAECCASPPCADADGDMLADCAAGEVLPDQDCASDADCAATQSCVAVPFHGRCSLGTFDNVGGICTSPGEQDAACGPTGVCGLDRRCEAEHPFTSFGNDCTADLQCSTIEPPDGICHSLPAVGRCSDGCAGRCGVDDDGDGFVDDADPEVDFLRRRLRVNRVDDDADGEVDEPDEMRLAAWDDDENGVIDDMHGAELGEMLHLGELFATTHPDRTSAVGATGWVHPTAIAGVAGAAIDNVIGVSGIHPNVALLPIGFLDAPIEMVFAYAESFEPDIVNISFAKGGTRRAGETDEEFTARFEVFREQIESNVDPNILYAVAVDNRGDDHDTPVAARGSFMIADLRLPQVISVANSWIDDALFHTSDFGAIGVDIAAPGSRFTMLAPGDNLASLQGTSFATPVVAGAAGVAISAFPAELRRHPSVTKTHLMATAAHAPALVGRVASGRVDLGHALASAPERAFYANETDRLHDRLYLPTTDAVFVVDEPIGLSPFPSVSLVVVYGGVLGPALAPRAFRVASFSGAPPQLDLRALEMRDQSATRLLGGFEGHHSAIATGDVHGDGCKDLVLAGLVGTDGIGGGRNLLLTQLHNNVDGCTGQWIIDGTLPNRDEVTRDAVLFDMEPDGDLDVLFLGANRSTTGIGSGTELLTNDGAGHFTDETGTHMLFEPSASGVSEPIAAEVCDVNRDGIQDVVVATSGPHNRLFFGVAFFGTTILVEQDPIAAFGDDTGFSTDVACRDLTGDGAPEIIFGRTPRQTLRYYENDGGGAFVRRTDLAPSISASTEALAVCDLLVPGVHHVFVGNGDISAGKTELSYMLGRAPSGELRLLPQELFGFDLSSTRSLTSTIECGDLDGDGVTDVVFVGAFGLRNRLYVRQLP